MDLDTNGLTEIGTSRILEHMQSGRLRRINLSNNKLGKNSINNILTMLYNYKIPLKWLYLENIGIHEDMAIEVANAVENHPGLTRFNFARNNLSEKAVKAVG